MHTTKLLWVHLSLKDNGDAVGECCFQQLDEAGVVSAIGRAPLEVTAIELADVRNAAETSMAEVAQQTEPRDLAAALAAAKQAAKDKADAEVELARLADEAQDKRAELAELKAKVDEAKAKRGGPGAEA